MNENIKSLRTLASNHGEHAFADMCTAALKGEVWAIERMEYAVAETVDLGHGEPVSNAWKLIIIRETDTTRPTAPSPAS